MAEWVKKIGIQLLSIGLVAAVFFVLGGEVSSQWHLIKNYEFNLKWHLVLLASGVYSISFFLLATGWWLLLRNINSPIKFSDAVIYFFISLPCKYIPGKIWGAVARAKLCKKYSVSTSVCFLTTGMEGIMEILAGIYISLFAVLSSSEFGQSAKIGAAAFVVLGLFLLIPRIFYSFVNIFLRLTHQPIIEREGRVGVKKLLVVQVVFGIAMLLMGLSQVIFLKALTHVPMKYTLYLISLGTFSYVASVLAFFTPGGLGVREGVWYIALKGIVIEYIGLIFALVSRLWTMIVEAILFVIALGFFLLVRENSEKSCEQGKVAKELS